MKKNNSKRPKKREKKYIPSKGTNPIELSKRIDLLNDKIEKNNKLADIREYALLNYISLMTNFASHDLKNSIHNLDGYVDTLDLANVTQGDIDNIKECIKSIRKTVSDFKTLAPDKSRSGFQIMELGTSLDLLNRGLVNSNNIVITFDYDKTDKTEIDQSLHNIIQMVTNLIMNSVKALETIKTKKIHVSINIDHDYVLIKVCDNGVGIEKENKDRIFELHFSTTGGSGIGLYHAKYITDSMNGEITYSGSDLNYSTVFTIKFPVNEKLIDTNN
jgi:signal transduction histidine kinase